MKVRKKNLKKYFSVECSRGEKNCYNFFWAAKVCFEISARGTIQMIWIRQKLSEMSF
jgi:hypothetical protein